MNTTATYQSGLEGVVAAQTRLSHVDGQKGELIVGGYAIEELAPHASFEEVVYLLWHDRLPSAQELAAWREELAAWRALPAATVDLLRELQANGDRPWMRCAWRQARWTWSCPMRCAATPAWARCLWHACRPWWPAYWRLRQGLEPIAPQTRAWAMPPTTCRCCPANGQARQRHVGWKRISTRWPTMVSMPRPLRHV